VAEREVAVQVSASWAAVYVDGAAEPRETPFKTRLAPGKHKLRFVNEVAGVDKTIEVVVPPDRDLQVTESIVP
jgi:hypothetical protein